MMVPTPIKLSILTAGLLLNMFAATPQAVAAETLPCMEEIDKFCKDIEPGGGRIIECLRSHQNELTNQCREKVDRILTKIKEAQKICAEDIKTLCGDVKPGGGRILQCLQSKAEMVSPPCVEQIELLAANKKPQKPIESPAKN